MTDIKIAAVIPARMASTRYPGKPLIEIQGLPMIEHVRRRALLCGGFSEVVVATCDTEILEAVETFGGRVIMTSKEHIMASDRVAEAALNLDCTHVINVQGDEILVMPDDLSKMLESIHAHPDGQYWNAIARIEKPEELADTAIVKCIVSNSGKILYCARDFTHLNLNNTFEPVRKILGILGYTRESLLAFSKLRRTPLESTQSIDQSRIIEHEIPLLAVPFEKGYPGINDSREEKMVRNFFQTDPIQKSVLKEISSF
jgi:3-deoxy-manno-octulosonate cytidylyltransferase (CMP-KDO synthetase)